MRAFAILILALLPAGGARAQGYTAAPAPSEAICASASAVAGGTIIGAQSGCPSQPQTRISAPVVLGPKFTIAGCAIVTTTGGAAAGSFIVPAVGSCNVTITIGSGAAPNGWVARANDVTSPANVVSQTGSTNNTISLSMTTTSVNETIYFMAIGF